MLRGMLQEKREEILRICAKYGARHVRVFGSVARGEADEESDIDLIVEFEPGRSLLDHAGLLLELEMLLERPVDVVSDRGLKPRVRERVLREAIPLCGIRKSATMILEVISAIERYAEHGREVYDRNELIQVWMVHHLQIIIESLTSISLLTYGHRCGQMSERDGEVSKGPMRRHRAFFCRAGPSVPNATVGDEAGYGFSKRKARRSACASSIPRKAAP